MKFQVSAPIKCSGWLTLMRRCAMGCDVVKDRRPGTIVLFFQGETEGDNPPLDVELYPGAGVFGRCLEHGDFRDDDPSRWGQYEFSELEVLRAIADGFLSCSLDPSKTLPVRRHNTRPWHHRHRTRNQLVEAAAE